MKVKTMIKAAFVILVSVAFLLLAVYSFRQYRLLSGEEEKGMRLQQGLQRADSIKDDSEAVTAYKKLSPMLPEIQLRIVQREWRMVMALMQYMNRSRDNVELQGSTDVYTDRLKTLLNGIIERCGSTLADTGSLSPDVSWQLYNAAGAAKVMNAFVMLETEQNADKVQGIVRDALADFKSAIEAVDSSGVHDSRRNIPRWNFEVLNGEGNVQKFEGTMTDTEKNEALKENLETLMPNMGGYGPGEPMETMIKK